MSHFHGSMALTKFLTLFLALLAFSGLSHAKVVKDVITPAILAEQSQNSGCNFAGSGGNNGDLNDLMTYTGYASYEFGLVSANISEGWFGISSDGYIRVNTSPENATLKSLKFYVYGELNYNTYSVKFAKYRIPNQYTYEERLSLPGYSDTTDGPIRYFAIDLSSKKYTHFYMSGSWTYISRIEVEWEIAEENPEVPSGSSSTITYDNLVRQNPRLFTLSEGLTDALSSNSKVKYRADNGVEFRFSRLEAFREYAAWGLYSGEDEKGTLTNKNAAGFIKKIDILAYDLSPESRVCIYLSKDPITADNYQNADAKYVDIDNLHYVWTAGDADEYKYFWCPAGIYIADATIDWSEAQGEEIIHEPAYLTLTLMCNGYPVPDADVVVMEDYIFTHDITKDKYTGKTDENGIFHITLPTRDDLYCVTATAYGCKEKTLSNISFQDSDTYEGKLAMWAAFIYTAKVMDGENLVQDAKVKVWNDKLTLAEVTTDSSGYAFDDGYPSGTYNVTVTADGYYTAHEEVTFGNVGRVTQTFNLTKISDKLVNVNLDFTVKCNNYNVEGAEVVFTAGEDFKTTVVTDANGAGSITLNNKDSYNVGIFS